MEPEPEPDMGPEPDVAEQPAVDRAQFTHRLGKYLINLAQTPLGTGTYGKVVDATHEETGEVFAMKLAFEQSGSQAQLHEVMTQQACQAHEFVVPIKDILYGHIVSLGPTSPNSHEPKQLAVVMEKLGGGDLFAEVVADSGMHEDKAKIFFRQILLAVAHVHARGVAHRDMKIENLLLTADKTAWKVCDFGLSKYLSEDGLASTILGSVQYIAPEVVDPAVDKYDGRKADMWSCGAALYVMVECAHPFPEVQDNVLTGNPRMLARLKVTQQLIVPRSRDLVCLTAVTRGCNQAAEYTLKPGHTPEFVAFLERLLSPDIGRRYSAEEALADPWLCSPPLDATTWGYLLRRELESYSTLQPPAVPGNYIGRDAWLAQVAVLTGHAPDEGTPPSDDEEETGF